MKVKLRENKVGNTDSIENIICGNRGIDNKNGKYTKKNWNNINDPELLGKDKLAAVIEMCERHKNGKIFVLVDCDAE